MRVRYAYASQPLLPRSTYHEVYTPLMPPGHPVAVGPPRHGAVAVLICVYRAFFAQGPESMTFSANFSCCYRGVMLLIRTCRHLPGCWLMILMPARLRAKRCRSPSGYEAAAPQPQQARVRVLRRRAAVLRTMARYLCLMLPASALPLFSLPRYDASCRADVSRYFYAKICDTVIVTSCQSVDSEDAAARFAAQSR